jgi:photosynthetic reaction center cytochrome c subunit
MRPAARRSIINRSSGSRADLALMMNFAESLSVNRAFCHDSRPFTDWLQSTPQRVTAWYGIRLIRDLNTNCLDPLKTTLPLCQAGGSRGMHRK